MQNRFVLSGVPRRARRFGDALLRVVEDDVCFVDRWAWLDDGCVAFELSLENTRDVAVKSFDRRELVLGDHEENDGHGVLCFEVRSAPASQSQSAELLEKCPANGKVVNSPSSGDAPDTHGVQTLTFSLSEGEQNTDAGSSRITLRFQTTTEGGTGATAWRGGLRSKSFVGTTRRPRHHSTRLITCEHAVMAQMCWSLERGRLHFHPWCLGLLVGPEASLPATVSMKFLRPAASTSSSTTASPAGSLSGESIGLTLRQAQRIRRPAQLSVTAASRNSSTRFCFPIASTATLAPGCSALVLPASCGQAAQLWGSHRACVSGSVSSAGNWPPAAFMRWTSAQRSVTRRMPKASL